ncbi:MAG TPA: helix-turn-helix transcriptional regulator [Ktedonobacteraceae bacterium]|nr:helix-turn-helix transcriptional regulator [Ktedonobacteraceae bacterium]
MNNSFYWWSCYAQFKPGEGILPHMGEVIAEYRQKRGFKTQADLAIAAGVSPRVVTEWETKAMLRDPERRVLLAKLLKIPPALFGLDWRTVFYTDNAGSLQSSSETANESWLEDAYYHYEDTLTMTWNLIYSGHFTRIVDRFERRLSKLESIARDVSGPDKEAWLALLCQYYQTAVQTPQHHLGSTVSKLLALQRCQTAISIAREIDDQELLAAAYFRLAGIYDSHGDHQLAREHALTALQLAKQVRDTTRGNIYLRIAGTSARFSANDPGLITEIRNWQDKALNIVYKGSLEPDRSFFRLNYAAVHHERAKVLLNFYQASPGEKKLLRDAQNEMKLAWNALTPDIDEWQMYFFNTEAQIYLAEHDLEGSARLALESLRTAREVQSKKGEKQVRSLFLKLQQHDNCNPYVSNLGVQLGMF